jgi:hypothetical protein
MSHEARKKCVFKRGFSARPFKLQAIGICLDARAWTLILAQVVSAQCVITWICVLDAKTVKPLGMLSIRIDDGEFVSACKLPSRSRLRYHER